MNLATWLMRCGWRVDRLWDKSVRDEGGALASLIVFRLWEMDN